jgi:hypothetical protein
MHKCFFQLCEPKKIGKKNQCEISSQNRQKFTVAFYRLPVNIRRAFLEYGDLTKSIITCAQMDYQKRPHLGHKTRLYGRSQMGYALFKLRGIELGNFRTRVKRTKHYSIKDWFVLSTLKVAIDLDLLSNDI